MGERAGHARARRVRRRVAWRAYVSVARPGRVVSAAAPVRRAIGLTMIGQEWSVVGGLRTHARVAGSPSAADGRGVVLVHGAVVSSRYMVPLARQLARDFRVWAPDLPGFGLS